MPSPFPGMDPYLEGEMWQEFHETLLDYTPPPPPPELSTADTAWLAAIKQPAART